MPYHHCPWCSRKFIRPDYAIRHILIDHPEHTKEERLDEYNKLRAKFELPPLRIDLHGSFVHAESPSNNDKEAESQ